MIFGPKFISPIRILISIFCRLTVLLCLGTFSAIAENHSAQSDHVIAAHYPPLMIDASDDFPGSAIEIVREAAKRAGRSIQLEYAPFQRALYELQNNSDKLMAALFRNESRETEFSWIAEIDATEVRFITIGEPVNSLAQARALKQISVESDSSPDRYLTRLGFENLVRVSNPDLSAQMLAAGRVDAWMLTKPLADQIWSDLDLPPAIIAGEVILRLPIYLAANVDFPSEVALQYKIAVDSMRQDGTLSAILEKY